MMNSIVSLPIVVVFFVGIASKMPDAVAAWVGFGVASAVMIAGQFWSGLHFLHIFFIGFLLGVASMALVTYAPGVRKVLRLADLKAYEEASGKAMVDMTPWRWLP